MIKLAMRLCAATLALCSLPALGQTLLNQASLNAAGGTISISTPGSYKLSSNLAPPAGKDAIDILTDNVHLDLNGFAILGSLSCPGPSGKGCAGVGFPTGIYAGGNNTVVVNGVVKGFYYGVFLYSSGMAEEIVASNNGYGIYAYNSLVKRNMAFYNSYAGITVYNGIVSENEVSGNLLQGIYAYYSTVLGNSVNGTQGVGVTLSYGIFGSNMIGWNTSGALSNSGAISQNNNFCYGSSC